MAPPSVFDHYEVDQNVETLDKNADGSAGSRNRPRDRDLSPGVYRVVGRTGDAVTMLRVADADHTRIHTGEVVHIDRGSLDSFSPAANPDGNYPIGGTVRRKLGMGYWSLRVFLGELRAHPVAALVAFGSLAVGVSGEAALSLPEPVSSLFVVVGALGLAILGSGRILAIK